MTNILIVDDKPEQYAELLNSICPSELPNESVKFVRCVRDAIDALRITRFDVLVVDMRLPETPWGDPVSDGGVKLLEHLAEDEDLRLPKYIIGVTAASEDDSAVTNIFDVQPWVLLRKNGGGNPWMRRLATLIKHSIETELNQDAVSYGSDICFLTALRSPEYEALSTSGVTLSESTPVDTNTYAQVGTLMSGGKSMSVVLGCCLRMGSTESALLACKLIDKYRPKLLIMGGICAGYEDKTQYGDVIVASPCWDYMSSKISVDEKGKREVNYAPDFISVDREIASRFDLLGQDRSLLQRIHSDWKGDKPRGCPSIIVGPSASGPAVVADEKVFQDIRRHQQRATIGLEMEAYGVYCAARMASRPRPVVFSAKAVCDYASFLKDDKYQKYAAYTSAAIIHAFLDRFGAELVDIIGQ